MKTTITYKRDYDRDDLPTLPGLQCKTITQAYNVSFKYTFDLDELLDKHLKFNRNDKMIVMYGNADYNLSLTKQDMKNIMRFQPDITKRRYTYAQPVYYTNHHMRKTTDVYGNPYNAFLFYNLKEHRNNLLISTGDFKTLSEKLRQHHEEWNFTSKYNRHKNNDLDWWYPEIKKAIPPQLGNSSVWICPEEFDLMYWRLSLDTKIRNKFDMIYGRAEDILSDMFLREQYDDEFTALNSTARWSQDTAQSHMYPIQYDFKSIAKSVWTTHQEKMRERLGELIERCDAVGYDRNKVNCNLQRAEKD